MSKRLRQNFFGVFIFFVVIVFLVFGWRLAGGYVLAPEDDFVQNYPAFASPGHLWTPLLLTGFPVLADPQVQYFYPLMRLARALPLEALGLGPGLTANFNLYMMSAYVLAGVFAALLGRKLTGSNFAGLLAGLVYAFSGYLISELKHVQVLHTALWFPLILYLIEELRTAEKRLLPALLLAAVIAVTIFAGHPQTALYVFAAACLYAIVRVIPPTSGDGSAKFLAIVFLAFFSGIAISAVQLLPSLELSSFGVRSTFTYKDFIVGQIEPLQIVGFILPYLMGGAYGTIGDLPFAEQGAPPGLMFFGFAPLILAIHALRSAGEKSQRGMIWFFAAIFGAACLISVGDNTPLGRLFYYLPFFSSFRGLYRILILCPLAMAMLAAFGLALLEKREPGDFSSAFQKLGRGRHVLVCVYVICAALSYPFLLGTLPLLPFYFKFARLTPLYQPNSTRRQWVLLLTVFLALASYIYNAEWTRESHLAADFAPPALAAHYAAATSRNHTRIFTVKGLAAERDQLPPNLSRLWGVANATGYEPLVPLRFSRLMGTAEGGFLQTPWRIKGADRTFDITSVQYMFAPWGQFGERAFDAEAKKKWKLVQAADRTLIFENRDVLPRFYLVPDCRMLDAESIFNCITSGKYSDGAKFEPEKTVLLEQAETGGINNRPENRSENKSEWNGKTRLDVQANDESLTFDLEMPGAGYLVVGDLFYPGWEAKVDGVAAPILKANYIQRAIALTAGRHRVVMSYHYRLRFPGI